MKRTLTGIFRKFTVKQLIIGAIIAVAAVIIIGGGTWELLMVTESSSLCGEVCHTPMHPEYTAYQVSPHSKVACSSCHVGAGSYNLISSKARGVPQIFETIFGTYPRPIPEPIKTLRPATETCEQCHTPSKFTGYLLQTTTWYNTDETNTSQKDTIVLNVGGGTAGIASGIHWHITAANVYYLPLDSKNLKIGWVGIEQNGKLTEYVDPALASSITPQMVEAGKRLMDCVDCHNRATHIFQSPNDLIDEALQQGTISQSLPFIKREALNAIGSPQPSLDKAYSRIDAIKQFYQTSYSQIYSNKATEIDQAINTLKGIARLTTFPEMRIDWNTYPDHSGHNKPPDALLAGLNITFTNWRNNQSEGCFRCHGKLVPASRTATGFTTGTATGYNGAPPNQPIDASCNLCHYSLTNQPGSPIPVAMPHPTTGLENCLLCHGPTGLKPFPANHPWTSNEACTFCHTPPQGAVPLPTPQPEVSFNIPHATLGLENCLLCHGKSGPKPVSASHPWVTNDVCATCHQLSPTPLPLPTSTPAKGIPTIPHSTRGLEDCLLCHGPGAPVHFVSSHPWSTNEVCYVCHGPSSTLFPIPASLPAPGIPAIPHSSIGLENCLLCHGPTGPKAFPASHPWTTNDTCYACHGPAASPLPIQPSVNLAPTIPHSIQGLSDCRVCHGVTVPIGTNHDTIPNDFCLYCHNPT